MLITFGRFECPQLAGGGVLGCIQLALSSLVYLGVSAVGLEAAGLRI
jgi:hypothetical protein